MSESKNKIGNFTKMMKSNVLAFYGIVFLSILLSSSYLLSFSQSSSKYTSNISNRQENYVDGFRSDKDILSSSSDLVQKQDTINNYVTVRYYSRVLNDRSGSLTLDMLMSHAYTYFLLSKQRNDNQSTMGVNNATTMKFIPQYAGACANTFTRRQENYKIFSQLLHDMNWTDPLPLQCPPYAMFRKWSYFNDKSSLQTGNKNETNYFMDHSNNNIVLLNLDTVKKFGSTLLTSEWLQFFLKQNPSTITTGMLATSTHSLWIDPLDDNNISYTNSSSSYQHDTVLNIVVLIRRGDVHPCKVTYDRYLPNSYYHELIDEYINVSLQTKYNNANNVNVTVFSESESYESFDSFIQRHYTVLLDTPLLAVWQTSMRASVLILSRSKFSFVPGLFNPNTVVYQPFFRYQPPPRDYNPWEIVRPELIQNAFQEVQDIRKSGNCTNTS